jgi:tetratricopeptide (TPR) repeat protein
MGSGTFVANETTMPAMKTIPSILSFLLLLNPLAAQQTGQPANPAVPGATTRPSASTGGASTRVGFVAGGQASAAATTGTPTRPSATYGGLGMPGVPGAGGGGFGPGTAAPGSLPASDEFAAGLLSEEAEQDLTSAAAAHRRTIQAFDRQRTEAANAIFRLGEVYLKMGRLEEAKVQYSRIVREFPDRVRLTELSHSLLLGEEGRSGTGSGPEARTTATKSSSVPTSGRGPDDVDRIMRERYGGGISGGGYAPGPTARTGI